jgi:hypothetical protein
VAARRPREETVDLCYVITLSTRVHTVSGGSSLLIRIMRTLLVLAACSSAASQRAERSTNFVIGAASSDAPR